MNAWSSIVEVAAPAAERPSWLWRRRVRLLASTAGAVAAFGVLAIANATTPPPIGTAVAGQTALQVGAAAQVSPAAIPTSAAPHVNAITARITGLVGPDLTESLRAAGVPEKQGREYVAALAAVIDLGSGLTIADRFDLVILREAGGDFGELAYAGLDRVGRRDMQLMKWTDGMEIRWVDAEGLDPSTEGIAMPIAGRVSSGFGERFHPVLNYRTMHQGVDFAAPHGTPIVAAATGRVVFAGWHGGYGRQVAIAHGDQLKTTYSHMSSIAASAGSHVRQGQVIGYVGSSGMSTGPHLHFEVYRNGRQVNPLSVKLTQSPLRGEELHGFRSRLRDLLVEQSAGV